MLSHGYFVRHTAEFYDFLRGVMLYPDAKPNGAHYALAQLERQGKLRAVITQNIDGLHQMAGSRNVLELHGESLNEKDLRQAIRYVEEADLLLVAGTSLVVYPVAGLVEYVRPGAKLVILNRDPTPYDSRADLVLRGDLVEELAHCVE